MGIAGTSARYDGKVGASRGCLEHNQTAASTSADGIGSAAGAQFGEDRGDVKLDGVFADDQASRDQLIGKAFAKQFEHFELAWGEAFGGWGQRLARAEETTAQGQRHAHHALSRAVNGSLQFGAADFAADQRPAAQGEVMQL